MAGRTGQHQFVVHHHLDNQQFELRPVDRRNAEIGFPVLHQPLNARWGGVVTDDDLHVRVSRPVLREDLGQQGPCERRGDGDHESPARLFGPRARLGYRIVQVDQQPLGQREEVAAGIRELDAARGALEQREADVFLQPAHQHAQCRLCEVQALRRSRKPAHLGHGHESAQVPQGEIH